MKTRPFEFDAFLASLIPFLNLNEIPKFALINKATSHVIHQLNTSEKFQQNSGVFKALVESLQRDATVILKNPLAIYNENNEALTTALKNIMAGKIDSKTINTLRNQKLIYQTNSPQAISIAGGTARLGFRAVMNRPSLLHHDPKGDLAILFLTLLLALVIFAIGGIEYGVRSCINKCRAKKQQEKLNQRLSFFKDVPESKECKRSDDSSLELQHRRQ